MIAPHVVVTNPALWAGAAALAIPLAVHLLTRRTRRTVRFPAIRFLQAIRASQSSLYRLRHWLLFTLRTLAVAAALAAFLKPVLDSGAVLRGAEQKRPGAVVIVLDASASMGYQASGSTLFSRARLAALGLAADLGPGDVANLLVAGAAPRPSFAEPSAGHALLRRDIESAPLTRERADMDGALAEAVRELRAFGRHARQIYLVSDFQRSTWSAVKFEAVPRDIKLVFVPVREEDPANAFLADVLVQPPFPAAGEEVDLVCRVANRNPRAAQIPLELRVEGGAPLRRTVAAGPGATASETFRLRAGGRGILEATASIPADRLPADDTWHLAVPVADRLRVVVASDGPPRGAAAVLAAAVDPFGAGGTSRYAVERRASRDLVPLLPGREHAAILCGCEPLGAEALDALLAYLAGGGSAVWFLESEQDAAGLLSLERRSGGALALPFRPGRLRAAAGPEDGAALTLQEANFDHPVLRRFRDAQELGEIRFGSCFATERVPGTGRVLARFSSGDAALALQAVGAGSLLVANFSPAPGRSDLARRTLFVPLVHEMLNGARPRQSGPAPFLVGQPCSTAVTGWRREDEIVFEGPDGARLSAVFDVRRDETAVTFPETRLDGFYRVLSGGRRLGSAAVNVDRRESELDYLAQDQLEALAAQAGGASWTAESADRDDLADLRHGRPLWHWCLLAALGCLVLEQALWLVWKE